VAQWSMRSWVDREKITAFMSEVGRSATGPGRVYLVGGSSVLLLGIRSQTIDIDLKLDPEPEGIFEAIAALKESLSVNVELASPDLFLPPLPGWQERSEFISHFGQVDFYHYDFLSQALAKILRGHEKDIADARQLLQMGKVDPTSLSSSFEQIKPALVRYPHINASDFEGRLTKFLRGFR